MRIFDLHNDLITGGASFSQALEIINDDAEHAITALYAVWGTRLDFKDFIEKCVFLSQNCGLYSVEDASVAGSGFSALPLKNLKCCSLTWNYDNIFAGGANGFGGLTELGKSFVCFLNDNNVAVDLSHLNERSFYDVIEIAKMPIVTHSGIFSLKHHARNLKDEQIKAVINKNGIVGLTPVPDFVPGGNEEGFFGSLSYFIDNFHDDNLAIGSDFYGSDGIDGLKSYRALMDEINVFLTSVYGKKCSKKVLCENAGKFFGI